MRRAIMTGLLACGKTKPINLVLMPNLREKVTHKNLVCGSIAEIKALIDEVIREAQIPNGLITVDYSLIGDDNLWYLR